MLQGVKSWLVARGPDSRLVRTALRLQARTKGLEIEFGHAALTISRPGRQMLMLKRHFIYVPLFLGIFNDSFDFFEPNFVDGIEILDFTEPKVRKYKESGVSLYCGSLPEEDSMEIYTRYHQPSAGEVVWDVGANCGFTTYHFSKLVGPDGRVIAWEPDPFNFECLTRNIEMHALTNVTAVMKALSSTSGTAMFDMDGSTGAGLSDFLVYTVANARSKVETVSFEDAVLQYGTPSLVKMDIEGGELDVIRGAAPFLQSNPAINFAIETHRLRNGRSTEADIRKMFRSASYNVTTSKDKLGQDFLWAKR